MRRTGSEQSSLTKGEHICRQRDTHERLNIHDTLFSSDGRSTLLGSARRQLRFALTMDGQVSLRNTSFTATHGGLLADRIRVQADPGRSRQIGAAAAGFGSQRAEPAVSSGERRRWWGSGDDDAAARSVRPRGGSGGGRTEAEVEAGAVGEGKVVVAREVRVRGGRSVLTRRPAR